MHVTYFWHLRMLECMFIACHMQWVPNPCMLHACCMNIGIDNMHVKKVMQVVWVCMLHAQHFDQWYNTVHLYAKNVKQKLITRGLQSDTALAHEQDCIYVQASQIIQTHKKGQHRDVCKPVHRQTHVCTHTPTPCSTDGTYPSMHFILRWCS